MTRSRVSFACLLLTLGLIRVAAGQTTSVSGTIVDPASQAYANGSYTVNFHPNGFQPSQYIWTGGSFAKQFTGVLDATGAFTVSLPDNTFITPVGSQWDFQVCPAASAVCTMVTLTVAGGSQNVGSSINAQLPATQVKLSPQPNASPLAKAYSDAEIVSPVAGAIYYNLTDFCPHTYNGTVWLTLCGGTATPTTSSHLFDEFCGGNATGIADALVSGQVGELGWLTNTNNAAGFFRYEGTLGVNQVNRPCIIDETVQGSNTWAYIVLVNINGANAGFLNLAPLTWTIQSSISDAIDNAADRFDNTATFGFVNNTGTSDPGQGMYFQCVSPASPTVVNYQCITRDGSGNTTTDSGVPCNSDFSFHNLKITNDGTGNIKFFIGGSQVCSQNTHISTSNLNPAFGLLNTNASANKHQLGIDYFGLDVTLSR